MYAYTVHLFCRYMLHVNKKHYVGYSVKNKNNQPHSMEYYSMTFYVY